MSSPKRSYSAPQICAKDGPYKGSRGHVGSTRIEGCGRPGNNIGNRAGYQRVGVEKGKRFARGQQRQRFQLVALRVARAENLAVQRYDIRAQSTQLAANCGAAYAWIVWPERPRLRFCYHQPQIAVFRKMPQAYCEQKRFVLQPPVLRYDQDIADRLAICAISLLTLH